MLLKFREGKNTMQKNVSMDGKDNRNDKLVAAMAYLGILVIVPFFYGEENTVRQVSSGTGSHFVCGGNPVRYFVPASGGNRPDDIMAALSDRKDRGICGVRVPGAFRDRNHKCGERAGEGTAGDWEGQVFQIERLEMMIRRQNFE